MQNYSVGRFTFMNKVYSTEASELRWPPGEFARELGIVHRSGVVSRFVFDQMKGDEYAEYRSPVGNVRVIVFND